jgi:hypothetical protein
MMLMLRRFWIQLTADPKKFGALCVVLGIGLLLWARLIVVSQPPRTAMANEPSTMPGAKAAARLPATSHSTKEPGSSSRAAVHIEMASTPAHDPFVISPRYFPKSSQIAESPKEPSKSLAQPAEEPQTIEARLLARLQSNADRFKLEAAIGGNMAVISGKTYRVGDTLQGSHDALVTFTLIEIKQRSVILECEGHRLELQMTLPGS